LGVSLPDAGGHLGGVFVLSSLIGVLTNGMQQRLDELRKGRSEVMETGHTVILGWSEQIFTILPELVAANSSERVPAWSYWESGESGDGG
jgi:hypothetical protein